MAKYKIGQLSKTMGVSTHSIKHYEKFKLIYPSKDDSTNYRYYDLAQYARIIECKKFRNIGVPIKDISNLLNNSDNDAFNDILDQHILDLTNKINTLMHQKELAESLRNKSNICDKYLNDWFIDIIPPIYLLKQSANKDIIEDSNCIINGVNLIDYIPLVESVLCIKKDSFHSNDLNYNWGLSISEENIKYFDDSLLKNSKFTKLKSRKAFITYIKLQLPYLDNGHFINTINEALKNFHFDVTSDVIAISLKKTAENDSAYEYFKIYVPID